MVVGLRRESEQTRRNHASIGKLSRSRDPVGGLIAIIDVQHVGNIVSQAYPQRPPNADILTFFFERMRLFNITTIQHMWPVRVTDDVIAPSQHWLHTTFHSGENQAIVYIQPENDGEAAEEEDELALEVGTHVASQLAQPAALAATDGATAAAPSLGVADSEVATPDNAQVTQTAEKNEALGTEPTSTDSAEQTAAAVQEAPVEEAEAEGDGKSAEMLDA